jgi:hypothetical protein
MSNKTKATGDTNLDRARAAGFEIVTYSSLSRFRNCRRKFKLGYVDGLKPKAKSDALWIGTIFHNAIEAHYKRGEIDVDRFLTEEQGLTLDDETRGTFELLRAMLRGYFARWGTSKSDKPVGVDPRGMIRDDELEYLYVEPTFVHKIRNPETGAKSRSFILSGKIDGLVHLKGTNELYIKENKTAATIDGAYLERLWSDFQSMLYARYIDDIVSDGFGMRVVGVLYDITEKTRIRRKAGETVDKFEERLGRYKTEKTIEKHREAGPKPAETWEAFRERMKREYENPDKMHRELIRFDEQRLADIDGEVWEMTQQILDARRRDRWSMNTSQCYSFGFGCSFVPICRAGGVLDEITANDFEVRVPFEELDDVDFDFESNGMIFQPTEKKVASTIDTGDESPTLPF